MVDDILELVDAANSTSNDLGGFYLMHNIAGFVIKELEPDVKREVLLRWPPIQDRYISLQRSEDNLIARIKQRKGPWRNDLVGLYQEMLRVAFPIENGT